MTQSPDQPSESSDPTSWQVEGSGQAASSPPDEGADDGASAAGGNRFQASDDEPGGSPGFSGAYRTYGVGTASSQSGSPGLGPPGYPPAPGYPPPAYGYRYPPPRVEVGRIWRWVWSRLGRNMVLVGGPLLLGVVVLLLLLSGVILAASLGDPAEDWVAGAAVLLAAAAYLYLAVGTVHASLVAVRGEKARLRDFLVFPNAWRAMAVLLICDVLVLLGVFLFVVGSFFAAYFCTFAVLIALDQNASVPRSFSMMRKGVREGMVPLFLVSRVVMGEIGNWTIIGWVVTAPAGQLMEALAYTRLLASAPAAPEQGGAEPARGDSL